MFLSARDAELPGRVWGTVMEAIIHHGRDSTLLRYAHEMKDPIIVRLKARGLIEPAPTDGLPGFDHGGLAASPLGF